MQKLKGWRHAPALALAIGAASAGTAAPVPPTRLGVSITSPSGSFNFANLALVGRWVLQRDGKGWENLPPQYLNANGELKAVPPGATVMRTLGETRIGNNGVKITCTYQGKGGFEVGGPSIDSVSPRRNGASFRITNRAPGSVVVLKFRWVDAADPIRGIDCRPDGTPANEIFTPDLLNIIKGFKVLRFMDWQQTNSNAPVTWATRHTRNSFDLETADGVPVEYMVDLAIRNHSDAWFNMPWNADADYIRRFAQYVHDNLPKDLKVYVECSNEVWNVQFPVARQAIKEGTERHLSDNPAIAGFYRYAQRLTEVMDIWASVFRDAPQRLVRVGATQNAVPYKSQLILGYRDTAKHIDAMATAPYFSYDRPSDPNNLDEIFPRIRTDLDHSLALAAQHKEIARRYGLRYMAYESGQGIVLQDLNLQRKIQRDPRMYDMYKRYIETWRREIGDTLILFGTVFHTRASGAWGLVEYDGQPASEAPKLRAVEEELAK